MIRPVSRAWQDAAVSLRRNPDTHGRSVAWVLCLRPFDRLTQVFSALRGRGRLSPADIDATCREIRIALLEADVALPVVRQFIARVKERAGGEEVSAR